MRVLVCGSRDWTDWKYMYAVLDNLGPIDEIIEGGAVGADRMARFYAKDHSILCTTYMAEWDKYNKKAGIIRNLLMLDADPDLVIAFHKNGSRGTAHTIKEARKRKIPTTVHYVCYESYE